mmetsp:Transcript_26771/g.62535  ORF Transcript_26771/g.62535 Transcript_26771/m.62535 type:complete len:208 (+) Transcript_26771:511-1134(+)
MHEAPSALSVLYSLAWKHGRSRKSWTACHSVSACGAGSLYTRPSSSEHTVPVRPCPPRQCTYTTSPSSATRASSRSTARETRRSSVTCWSGMGCASKRRLGLRRTACAAYSRPSLLLCRLKKVVTPALISARSSASPCGTPPASTAPGSTQFEREVGPCHTDRASSWPTPIREVSCASGGRLGGVYAHPAPSSSCSARSINESAAPT